MTESRNHFFEASPFYDDDTDPETPAGWGIWDIKGSDWIVPDGFETQEEASHIADSFNWWAEAKARERYSLWLATNKTER